MKARECNSHPISGPFTLRQAFQFVRFHIDRHRGQIEEAEAERAQLRETSSVKLNWLGRAAMNSRARAIAQGYVASLLVRMGGKLDGGAALEIGCGGGLGAEIILDRFAAESVLAIDLDFAMLAAARRRLVRRGRGAVRLAQANAVALPAGDATFDAVFDFGAIHLESEWRRALAEVARVLEPGGRYYFEVVASRALRIAYPLLSEGFGSMEPPAVDSFLRQLARVGIEVGTQFVRPRLAAVSGWVGDLVGVGVRAGVPSAGRTATEQLEEPSGCTERELREFARLVRRGFPVRGGWRARVGRRPQGTGQPGPLPRRGRPTRRPLVH